MCPLNCIEHQKYLNYKSQHEKELANKKNKLPKLGYDIIKYDERERSLEIMLKEEENNFDKKSVEKDFRKTIRACSEAIDLKIRFKVRYEKNIVTISFPNNSKYMSFLRAYCLIYIKREMKRL